MSYKDGWAALNLEMPDRVPRTEYSAEFHWKLVQEVTGIRVDSNSTEELQQRASNEFRKAWDYGFVWNMPLILSQWRSMADRNTESWWRILTGIIGCAVSRCGKYYGCLYYSGIRTPGNLWMGYSSYGAGHGSGGIWGDG